MFLKKKIKEFLKKVIYKIVTNYSENYIDHTKYINRKFFQNNIRADEYYKFVLKNVIKNKKFSLFEIKIIFIFITILFQLSARASSNKLNIIVISREIDLNKIDFDLKKILPTDTKYKVVTKVPKNLDRKIVINLTSQKIFKNSINIFFEKTNKIIKVLDFNKKVDDKFPIFINEIKNYFKEKKNFEIIDVKSKRLLQKSIIFTKKLNINYFNIYNEYSFQKNKITLNKKKIFLSHKDIIKVFKLKNVFLSFHGTISKARYMFDELRYFSLRDGFYNGYNKNQKTVLIPKITKTIKSDCIVFPSTASSIGHYFFESISTIALYSNYKNLKIIVYENIPNYILDILKYFGISRNNIIRKPAFETWKLKKLLVPIFNNNKLLPLMADFLNRDIKKRKIISNKKKDKIYITRRDSRSSRILINEEEIIKYLEKKNYRICNFSKLNIVQKIKLLSKAKTIVSPVGAGLFNLFFANISNSNLYIIAGKIYMPRVFLDLSFYKKININIMLAKTIPSYSQWWKYNHSSIFLNKKILDILP